MVKHLMERYGLTEQDCNKEISDLHLDSISRSCCTGGAWKGLATHILETESVRAADVVSDIERKQISDEEKRRDFFYHWKQMKGSDATYKALITALSAGWMLRKC